MYSRSERDIDRVSCRADRSRGAGMGVNGASNNALFVALHVRSTRQTLCSLVKPESSLSANGRYREPLGSQSNSRKRGVGAVNLFQPSVFVVLMSFPRSRPVPRKQATQGLKCSSLIDSAGPGCGERFPTSAARLATATSLTAVQCAVPPHPHRGEGSTLA